VLDLKCGMHGKLFATRAPVCTEGILYGPHPDYLAGLERDVWDWSQRSSFSCAHWVPCVHF